MSGNNKHDGWDVASKAESIGSERLRSPLHDLPATTQAGIKMVRYRLDVGFKHQVSVEELKKILIEESGVDKNNINIINIQGDYTLVEMPDEMPQDIFLHLKSVEIKQHKLDIKRVKARNKKRGNNRGRRGRGSTSKSADQSVVVNRVEQIKD